jgi:hypothetical protein
VAPPDHDFGGMTLVVRLTWPSGLPLQGLVGRPGAAGIAFCGWIDFMSAISTLCKEARPEAADDGNEADHAPHLSNAANDPGFPRR